MTVDNLGDIEGLSKIRNILETLKNLEKKSLLDTQTKFLEEISSLTGMYLKRYDVFL
jgi:hypothetical protein